MENVTINHFFRDNRKIAKCYNDYLDKITLGYNLSPNEIAVLAHAQTQRTASAIASSLNVSKALVSRSVKNLKNLGFIVTEKCSDDKREQSIILTPDGVEISNKIVKANNEFYDVAFKSFDDNEKAVLSALVGLILKNLNIAN